MESVVFDSGVQVFNRIIGLFDDGMEITDISNYIDRNVSDYEDGDYSDLMNALNEFVTKRMTETDSESEEGKRLSKFNAFIQEELDWIL